MGFIKAMHPKSSIAPTREDVQFAIENGMIGQKKINGARCQIHIENGKVIALYTRQGTKHTVAMPEEFKKLIGETFATKKLTVLDSEWLRFSNRIYLFDCLVYNGILLRSLSYKERYQFLQDHKIRSVQLVTLPLLKTISQCLKILEADDSICEGLVFKKPDAKGFNDYNIVRCRK